MDGISFLIKRFFYSFLSGCVIIFYVVIYYYALQETSAFSSEFGIMINIIVKYIKINSIFVFIIFAVFLSIIIEGICQIGLEKYLPLNDKKKKFKDKKKKDLKTHKERREYSEYKITEKILEFIFLKPSILWVCKSIKETDFNPMAKFIKDSGLEEEKCKYFNCNLNYNAVYICARVIEREGKINNIYHYRDNSYIIQMLRLTFFCMSLTTFFYGLVICILAIAKVLKFNEKGCVSFFVFISCLLVISILVFFSLSEISHSFAKRFVREVGYTYEAMGLKLKINDNRDSSMAESDACHQKLDNK